MTRFAAVAVLVAALVLVACDARRTPDQFDPARGVVFPASKAATLTMQCARDRMISDGAWTPTPQQIVRLEEKLAPVLAEKLRALPPNGQLRTVEAYYRQYGGLLVGGTPVIYINGFRENIIGISPDRDLWRRSPISVCVGGGEWYFVAFYDPETELIGNFEFNR